jgi:transposase
MPLRERAPAADARPPRPTAQFRALATRYAKRTAYYQAEPTIVAIVLWLR